MNDEALLARVTADMRLRETGPACALCRHVGLTVEDWPDAFGDSDSIRQEMCPKQRMWVSADGGFRCPDYERRGSDA